MATEEKIRRAIREIASRKRNVEVDDIDWVMTHLKAYEKVGVKSNDHQRMYSVNGHRFGVCTHHAGSKQVKAPYVSEFLSVMAEYRLV